MASRLSRPSKNGKEKPVVASILDRMPPHSEEAEIALIGSLLLRPDIIDELPPIDEGDFYDAAHGILFGHIREMHNANRKVDLTLLVERLKKSGDLERVGGAAYLAQILQSVPNAAHASYYFQIVRDKATLRAIILASEESLCEAFEDSESAETVLDLASKRVFAIHDKRSPARTTSVSEALHEVFADLDERKLGNHRGLLTGYRHLDDITNGLQPGHLIVIAGRTSMGKSALAANIVEHAAIDSGAVCLVFSFEMNAAEWTERLLSSRARVDSYSMRCGRVTTEEQSRLLDVAGEIYNAAIHLEDRNRMSALQIAVECRRVKRRLKRLDLVVIDYLQLIEPSDERQPRYVQVGRITRELKALAEELNVPLILVAQLNREPDAAKDDKRPKMSHLRESGNIEQDANLIVFPFRPNYYTNTSIPSGKSEDNAELIVAKHRSGRTGTCAVKWYPAFTCYADEKQFWVDGQSYVDQIEKEQKAFIYGDHDDT